ncbi:MAG: hypothetical protein ACT4PU_03175 [Planctomycetota bacterium]
MSSHRRILVVVTRAPRRGATLATSELVRLPPRDAALAAARLMRLGAEVRIMDQDTESLSDRTVRREARWWRAELVLLWAGGSEVADDPVPDERPLRALLSGWAPGARLLAVGPLARHYSAQLLARLPRLEGALTGGVGGALARGEALERIPGAIGRQSAGPALALLEPPTTGPESFPAWQSLPLDACAARSPDGLRSVDLLCGSHPAALCLEEVRHALHRAGARFLHFADRDLLADPERAHRIARGMLAAAPGVPWACRVRAASVAPALAVALLNGGCRQVLVAASGGPDEPGVVPMDDPQRPRLESAVESLRGVGLSTTVEHVIGRPGHDPDQLAAWQRWFADRGIVVRAHVRMVHPAPLGAERPAGPLLALEEARRRAGCWDNTLRPRDVERAVRAVSEPRRRALAAGSLA